MSRMQQADLFSASPRMEVGEAMELTVQSLLAHATEHQHWAIAWSGGKDSTCTLTLVLSLIESGAVPRPKTLTVFYADTRMELLPLAVAAHAIMDRLRQIGVTVEIVRAPLDKRFYVYILGRGVPPPNNNTLRWCTRQIKVEPMQAALEARLAELGGTALMITGVRQGESAIRDRRIEMSCSKDGAECGQGWYQQVIPNAKGLRGKIATLAPILHWRVCLVWDWLRIYAPMARYGGWYTAPIADAYGGDEAEELNARTGCIGCPLAEKETALDAVLLTPEWAYLEPLRRLKPIYRWLRRPENRLRKEGLEPLKNGGFASNPQRLGPITFEARLQALDQILANQAEVNAAAQAQGRPLLDLLDATEEARIRELIAAETWPQGWDGDEPTGDVPLDKVYEGGVVQPLLVR
ncbi:MAG TPA: phosphoadenosine phosphosulfate reductase family protein [Solimonas sp.]